MPRMPDLQDFYSVHPDAIGNEVMLMNDQFADVSLFARSTQIGIFRQSLGLLTQLGQELARRFGIVTRDERTDGIHIAERAGAI